MQLFIFKVFANLAFLVSLISYFGMVTKAQETGPVDYSNLGELNVEMIVNTEEQAGVYSVNLMNLVVTADGTMIVSDLGKTTVEQYNPEGEFVARIASEGRGPGELPFLFKIFRTSQDSLVVWHEQAGRVDYFYTDNIGIYQYVRSLTIDPFPLHRLEIIGYEGSRNPFAYTGHTDAVLISSGSTEYRNTPVAILDETLTVQRDSLVMLKKPNYILTDPAQYSSPVTIGGLAILGLPPYRYEDHFVLMSNNQYMVARARSATLFFYTENHEQIKKLSLDVQERPVEKNDLDYAFKDHRLNKDRKIIGKLESYVEEVKPPFLNVWHSENHILLHTDIGEKGREMIILTMNGQFIGRFYISEYDEVQRFVKNRIYVLHKNPAKGHSIRVYKVGI